MATKRQKIEVGAFLTVAFSLLAGVLAVLAGLHRTDLIHYYIEFEENVSGLSEGTKVTYRGVPVGKITQVGVTRENRIGVTIGVDPKKVTLREGVAAKYTMETLLGPFVIDLVGGEVDAAVLKPGSEIPVRASLLYGIEQNVPGTLQRVNRLIDSINRVLAEVSAEDVAQVISEVKAILAETRRTVAQVRQQTGELVDSLDETVRAARAELEQTGGKARAALEKLQGASEQATEFLDTLEKTVEDNRVAVNAVLKRLDEALARLQPQLEKLDLAATDQSIRQAAQKVGRAADTLGDTAEAIGRSSVSLDAAAQSAARTAAELRRSLANLERILARSFDELDRTLRSARRLLDTLERDPAALIRGKEGPPR
ncbi:MAG: MlaD family protein [Candidatus Brocadiia bacterium]